MTRSRSFSSARSTSARNESKMVKMSQRGRDSSWLAGASTRASPMAAAPPVARKQSRPPLPPISMSDCREALNAPGKSRRSPDNTELSSAPSSLISSEAGRARSMEAASKRTRAPDRNVVLAEHQDCPSRSTIASIFSSLSCTLPVQVTSRLDSSRLGSTSQGSRRACTPSASRSGGGGVSFTGVSSPAPIENSRNK